MRNIYAFFAMCAVMVCLCPNAMGQSKKVVGRFHKTNGHVERVVARQKSGVVVNRNGRLLGKGPDALFQKGRYNKYKISYGRKVFKKTVSTRGKTIQKAYNDAIVKKLSARSAGSLAKVIYFANQFSREVAGKFDSWVEIENIKLDGIQEVKLKARYHNGGIDSYKVFLNLNGNEHCLGEADSAGNFAFADRRYLQRDSTVVLALLRVLHEYPVATGEPGITEPEGGDAQLAIGGDACDISRSYADFLKDTTTENDGVYGINRNVLYANSITDNLPCNCGSFTRDSVYQYASESCYGCFDGDVLVYDAKCKQFWQYRNGSMQKITRISAVHLSFNRQFKIKIIRLNRYLYDVNIGNSDIAFTSTESPYMQQLLPGANNGQTTPYNSYTNGNASNNGVHLFDNIANLRSNADNVKTKVLAQVKEKYLNIYRVVLKYNDDIDSVRKYTYLVLHSKDKKINEFVQKKDFNDLLNKVATGLQKFDSCVPDVYDTVFRNDLTALLNNTAKINALLDYMVVTSGIYNYLMQVDSPTDELRSLRFKLAEILKIKTGCIECTANPTIDDAQKYLYTELIATENKYANDTAVAKDKAANPDKTAVSPTDIAAKTKKATAMMEATDAKNKADSASKVAENAKNAAEAAKQAAAKDTSDTTAKKTAEKAIEIANKTADEAMRLKIISRTKDSEAKMATEQKKLDEQKYYRLYGVYSDTILLSKIKIAKAYLDTLKNNEELKVLTANFSNSLDSFTLLYDSLLDKKIKAYSLCTTHMPCCNDNNLYTYTYFDQKLTAVTKNYVALRSFAENSLNTAGVELTSGNSTAKASVDTLRIYIKDSTGADQKVYKVTDSTLSHLGSKQPSTTDTLTVSSSDYIIQNGEITGFKFHHLQDTTKASKNGKNGTPAPDPFVQIDSLWANFEKISTTDVMRLILFNNNMISQNMSYSTVPIFPYGDRLGLTIQIGPSDSLTTMGITPTSTEVISFDFPVYGKPQFSFSAGTFAGLSSKYQTPAYEWQQVPTTGGTVQGSSPYRLAQTGKGAPPIGIGGLANVTWKIRSWFCGGFSGGFGATAETTIRMAFLAGATLSLGTYQQFHITSGVSEIQVNSLKTDYIGNNNYYAGNPGSVPYYQHMEPGWFLSLTYTLYSPHNSGSVQTGGIAGAAPAQAPAAAASIPAAGAAAGEGH